MFVHTNFTRDGHVRAVVVISHGILNPYEAPCKGVPTLKQFRSALAASGLRTPCTLSAAVLVTTHSTHSKIGFRLTLSSFLQTGLWKACALWYPFTLPCMCIHRPACMSADNSWRHCTTGILCTDLAFSNTQCNMRAHIHTFMHAHMHTSTHCAAVGHGTSRPVH